VIKSPTAAASAGNSASLATPAIVVTLDTYLLAWRERDIQNAYLPFMRGEGLANYLSDPVFRAAIGGVGAVGIITEVVVQGVPSSSSATIR